MWRGGKGSEGGSRGVRNERLLGIFIQWSLTTWVKGFMGTVVFGRCQQGDSDPPMVFIGVYIFLSCPRGFSFHFTMDHGSGDPVLVSVGRWEDFQAFTMVCCPAVV